ncbi:acyl carrier protein-like protein, partial [Tanacetum coccineum]
KGSHSENGKDKVKDENADGNLSNSSSDSEDVDSGPTNEDCAAQFKSTTMIACLRNLELLEDMETCEAIEDQFSKLHPCFHTDTKIGIIGAGSSGLSAAYALCKLGYTNVTILEKHHSVRGMCEICINCRLALLNNCSKWDWNI